MKSLTGKELVQAVDRFKKGETVRLYPLQCFKIGVNHFGFNEAVRNYPKLNKIDTITVPLNTHQDYIGNYDLDGNFHKGFTVGKGKVLYFMMTWHRSGSCTVYPKDNKHWPRNLVGDEKIKIYFKH